MDIVPARKFLPIQRVEDARRQDARAEDIRSEVELLSSKQVQLLQLQVHAAQYQKAYIDERVGTAAHEARNNAEAIGIAVTQVHADQVVIKKHLGAHLHAVKDFLRQQLDGLNQDVSHRQFLALGAVDRRLDELAQNALANTNQIKAIPTGQDEFLASFQQGLHRRIDDLETSATLAIQSLESQVALLDSDSSSNLAQRIEEVAVEGQHRHRPLEVAQVDLEQRLTAQVLVPSAPTTGGLLHEIKDIKANLQLRLFEASAKSLNAVSDAEARIMKWVQAEMVKHSVSGSVGAIEEKLSAQCGEISLLRASVANTLEPPSHSFASRLRRVNEQEKEIEQLHVRLAKQENHQSQCTSGLHINDQDQVDQCFAQQQTRLNTSALNDTQYAHDLTRSSRSYVSESEDEEQILSTRPASHKTRGVTPYTTIEPVGVVQTWSAAAQAHASAPEFIRNAGASYRLTSTTPSEAPSTVKTKRSKLQLAREAARHRVERMTVSRERQLRK